MYTGIYRLADCLVLIQSIHPEVHDLCADYRADGTPRYTITTAQPDIDFEREKSAEEDALEGIPTRWFPDSYLETLAVYRKLAGLLLWEDVLLFHGSVISVDGQAYLFTAKSGTGKSTHTRLWRQHFGSRAFMVNDDKPLLRINADGVTVYGTPWDGKHRLSTNTAVPLKALCILERDETNHIHPISLREAFPMLLQQSYRPNEAAGVLRTMELLEKLGKQAGLYRLGCNMDPEAAIVAYRGMNGGTEHG